MVECAGRPEYEPANTAQESEQDRAAEHAAGVDDAGGVFTGTLVVLTNRREFGVAPLDPTTFVGVAIVMAAVTMAACYIPARRAMRVDPMVALRND